MPKWVYPLAFVFLIFLIYNDPTGAGQMANSFTHFVSQLLSAVGEFLSGLFGDVNNASGATSGTSVTLSGGGSVGTTPTTDALLHGHTHVYNG